MLKIISLHLNSWFVILFVSLSILFTGNHLAFAGSFCDLVFTDRVETYQDLQRLSFSHFIQERYKISSTVKPASDLNNKWFHVQFDSYKKSSPVGISRNIQIDYTNKSKSQSNSEVSFSHLIKEIEGLFLDYFYSRKIHTESITTEPDNRL